MRRKDSYNRNKNREKKERLIMLGSAVFVLAALTMTGVYVRGNSQKEKDDGYTIDFSALEEPESTEQKPEESQEPVEEKITAGIEKNDTVIKPSEITADDFMDYVPPTAMANDDGTIMEAPVEEEPEFAQAAEFSELEADSVAADGEAVTNVTQPALQFSEQDTLTWPIVGNVLINYSMDKTTYFSTLQQYKYSPALVIAAAEGELITAAADGKVVEILEDEEIGKAVVMDLGGGYELTYGQLSDIQVSKGSYVSCGDAVGSVAAPTKYYSVEGANVYFKLTKDGVPVDPMGRLN